MNDADRRGRAAARRARIVLARTRLGDASGDLVPVFGDDAISLVTQLTRESWSEAGLAEPTYARADTPIRFVRRGER